MTIFFFHRYSKMVNDIFLSLCINAICFIIFIVITITTGVSSKPSQSVFMFKNYRKIKEVNDYQIPSKSDGLSPKERMTLCKNIANSTYFRMNDYKFKDGVPVDRERTYKITSHSYWDTQELISAFKCPVHPPIYVRHQGKMVVVIIERPKYQGCSEEDFHKKSRTNRTWIQKVFRRVERILGMKPYYRKIRNIHDFFCLGGNTGIAHAIDFEESREPPEDDVKSKIQQQSGAGQTNHNKEIDKILANVGGITHILNRISSTLDNLGNSIQPDIQNFEENFSEKISRANKDANILQNMLSASRVNNDNNGKDSNNNNEKEDKVEEDALDSNKEVKPQTNQENVPKISPEYVNNHREDQNIHNQDSSENELPPLDEKEDKIEEDALDSNKEVKPQTNPENVPKISPEYVNNHREDQNIQNQDSSENELPPLADTDGITDHKIQFETKEPEKHNINPPNDSTIGTNSTSNAAIENDHGKDYSLGSDIKLKSSSEGRFNLDEDKNEAFATNASLALKNYGDHNGANVEPASIGLEEKSREVMESKDISKEDISSVKYGDNVVENEILPKADRSDILDSVESKKEENDTFERNKQPQTSAENNKNKLEKSNNENYTSLTSDFSSLKSMEGDINNKFDPKISNGGSNNDAEQIRGSDSNETNASLILNSPQSEGYIHGNEVKSDINHPDMKNTENQAYIPENGTYNHKINGKSSPEEDDLAVRDEDGTNPSINNQLKNRNTLESESQLQTSVEDLKGQIKDNNTGNDTSLTSDFPPSRNIESDFSHHIDPKINSEESNVEQVQSEKGDIANINPTMENYERNGDTSQNNTQSGFSSLINIDHQPKFENIESSTEHDDVQHKSSQEENGIIKQREARDSITEGSQNSFVTDNQDEFIGSKGSSANSPTNLDKVNSREENTKNDTKNDNLLQNDFSPSRDIESNTDDAKVNSKEADIESIDVGPNITMSNHTSKTDMELDYIHNENKDKNAQNEDLAKNDSLPVNDTIKKDDSLETENLPSESIENDTGDDKNNMGISHKINSNLEGNDSHENRESPVFQKHYGKEEYSTLPPTNQEDSEDQRGDKLEIQNGAMSESNFPLPQNLSDRDVENNADPKNDSQEGNTQPIKDNSIYSVTDDATADDHHRQDISETIIQSETSPEKSSDTMSKTDDPPLSSNNFKSHIDPEGDLNNISQENDNIKELKDGQSNETNNNSPLVNDHSKFDSTSLLGINNEIEEGEKAQSDITVNNTGNKNIMENDEVSIEISPTPLVNHGGNIVNKDDSEIHHGESMEKSIESKEMSENSNLFGKNEYVVLQNNNDLKIGQNFDNKDHYHGGNEDTSEEGNKAQPDTTSNNAQNESRENEVQLISSPLSPTMNSAENSVIHKNDSQLHHEENIIVASIENSRKGKNFHNDGDKDHIREGAAENNLQSTEPHQAEDPKNQNIANEVLPDRHDETFQSNVVENHLTPFIGEENEGIHSSQKQTNL